MRHGSPNQHAPRVVAFHFIAGRLCLDFANTGGERDGVAFEDVTAPAELARWFAESGLTAPGIVVTDADLQAARVLRDALWRAGHRYRVGQTPERSDVALINRAAGRPSLAPQIDAARGDVRWATPLTAQAALATIARDAVDLFTGDQAARIRECASPTCILLFVDTSRPGKRRWCAMDLCGNRAKTAQYRRARRAVQ